MADIPYLFRLDWAGVSEEGLPFYINEPAVRPLLPATNGGRGSFSYLDTKVYGPRTQRQMYNMFPRFTVNDRSIPYNDVILGFNVPVSPPRGFIIPGTGGSAKLPGRRYFGSRGIGYSPNGLILLRLIKI